MKKRDKKALVLGKETIRLLDQKNLNAVVGGTIVPKSIDGA